MLSTIPAPGSSQIARLARRDLPEARPTALATASVATDQLPRHRGDRAGRGDAGHGGGEFRRCATDLGLRVVLVPTHPRQSWYADAPDGAPTLHDFLNLAYTGRLNGEVPGQLHRTPLGNLRILPHGETKSDELIDGLPPLLRSFADSGVDVTVIAAPSMLEDPSATICGVEHAQRRRRSGRRGDAAAGRRGRGQARAGRRARSASPWSRVDGPTVDESQALELSDRLHVVPSATRRLGSDLLVSAGSATRPVETADR